MQLLKIFQGIIYMIIHDIIDNGKNIETNDSHF